MINFIREKKLNIILNAVMYTVLIYLVGYSVGVLFSIYR